MLTSMPYKNKCKIRNLKITGYVLVSNAPNMKAVDFQNSNVNKDDDKDVACKQWAGLMSLYTYTVVFVLLYESVRIILCRN